MLPVGSIGQTLGPNTSGFQRRVKLQNLGFSGSGNVVSILQLAMVAATVDTGMRTCFLPKQSVIAVEFCMAPISQVYD